MSPTLDPTLRQLNDCACCEGLRKETPVRIYNRPGLRAIAYRVGDHARFKATMLAALSATKKRPALAGLRTRDDDLSIALLDAWATVADVLAFYQERIANESYLRTATERLSVAHLAELIGYHLQPGVAAETYLAFTVDESVDSAEIDKGTRVQSIPTSGGQPQTFETVEAITARAAWNEINPRLRQPQEPEEDMQSITVAGVATQVKPGDSLLIIYDSDKDPVIKKVLAVHVDIKAETTRFDLTHIVEYPPWKKPFFDSGKFLTPMIPFTGRVVQQQVLGLSWPAADLHAFANVQQWSLADLAASVTQYIMGPKGPPEPEGDKPLPGVHAFRKRAALFGHNAPKWETLPANQRLGEWIKIQDPGPKKMKKDHWDDPIYPESENWDHDEFTLKDDAKGTKQIYLDNAYPEIVEDSWVVLDSPNAPPKGYRVENSEEITRAAFTLQAKVSRLTLYDDRDFDSFKLRETTVLAQSEELTLVDIPIPNDVEDEVVQLDGFYPNLKAGQNVILSGECSDAPGVTACEMATIDEVRIEDGYTVLELKRALKHKYLRDTVIINANVALATHGETKQEALGSGDGSKSYQHFALKNKALTYVSSSESSGSASTLEVRVNKVLWHEAEDLARLGLHHRRYIARLDDKGNTTITFGDGEHGTRLPTGTENVIATYRSGSGLAGNLDAEQLTLLTKRPPGLRAVTNPLPASGGDDAESRDRVRRNAPLTVLTLDRIVSSQDYEDFARAFAGVAKALATRSWQGQTQAVFLTIAGPMGAAIPSGSATYNNLMAAMRKCGDPHTPLHIESYWPVWFQIQAKVKTHEDHLEEEVLAEIERKLRAHYSFDAREFGQPVAVSEVIGVIQNVTGVVAVDIDYLFCTGESKAWNARLTADRPRSGGDISTMRPAQLLTLDPRPLKLGVMP